MVLIQNHFNFLQHLHEGGVYFKTYVSNLLTGRIVQNIVEIIILFVFVFYHNLPISLSDIQKDPLFISF